MKKRIVTSSISFLLLVSTFAMVVLVPTSGPVFASNNIGNGRDYAVFSSTSPNPVTWTGKFTSETGYVFEYSLQDGGPSGGAGVYTLQTNTNLYQAGNICTTGNGVNCWLQFVYSACPVNNCPGPTSEYNAIFFEEWAFGYAHNVGPCTNIGNYWQTNGNDCVADVGILQIGSVAPGSLSGVYLVATASAAQVTIQLCLPGGCRAASTYTLTNHDIPSPAGHWSGTEFAIVGYSGGDLAVFNPGISLTTTVTVSSTTVSSCSVSNSFSGYTGEQNDLHLGGCTYSGSTATFTQSSVASVTNLTPTYATLCNGTNNCNYCLSTTSCSTTVTVAAGYLIVVVAEGPWLCGLNGNCLSITDSAAIDSSHLGSGWKNQVWRDAYTYNLESSIWSGYNAYGCNEIACFSAITDTITVTSVCGGCSGNMGVQVLEVPAGVGYTVSTAASSWYYNSGQYTSGTCSSASGTNICTSSVTQSPHPQLEVAGIGADTGSSLSTPGSGYSFLWGTYNALKVAEYSTTQSTTTFNMVDAATAANWVDVGCIFGYSSNGS